MSADGLSEEVPAYMYKNTQHNSHADTNKQMTKFSIFVVLCLSVCGFDFMRTCVCVCNALLSHVYIIVMFSELGALDLHRRQGQASDGWYVDTGL